MEATIIRGARFRVAAVTLLLAATLAACGDDDGAGVREVGSGSASASGSGSASGTGSATGSGSGSGSSIASCRPVGDPSTADEMVAVTLDEFSVEPATDAVRAGSITFDLTNNGEEDHEFVIAEGDDPASLPVSEGQVDESQLPDGALIGEVEAFPAGLSCEGTFDLRPGSHVLFCNLVEEGEDGTLESHFEEGMATTFTVR